MIFLLLTSDDLTHVPSVASLEHSERPCALIPYIRPLPSISQQKDNFLAKATVAHEEPLLSSGRQ
jgi:hypothetical protein